jgi:hypothetical protein
MSGLRNLKKFRISVILCLLAILPLTAHAHGYAKPLIIKETYTYTQSIRVGNGYYHQHCHEGAIYADAWLTSSTGEVDFYHNWMAPWLKVWIINKASYEVTVQWVECFYVN